MSSLVRRIEKRIMKRAKFTRERWYIGKDGSGQPKIIECRRGGEITDPDDNPIGRHWPERIPARAKMPSKAPRKNPVPFAVRRSKRSQAWLDARHGKAA